MPGDCPTIFGGEVKICPSARKVVGFLIPLGGLDLAEVAPSLFARLFFIDGKPSAEADSWNVREINDAYSNQHPTDPTP